MQNNFFKRNNGKKSVTESKAIYMVVLLLLLAACASTAVVSWLSGSGEKPAPEQSNRESYLPPIETIGPDENDLMESSKSLTQKQTEKKKDKEKNNDKQTSATPVTTQNPTVYPTFQKPVSGEISMEYSMDKPVFSKTLDEWRTHSGVDIKADVGTAVSAAAAGEVEFVKNDPRYGVTVIVNHGNNVKTVYSNMANELSVVEKQKVKAGDILGAVGDTASFETLEDTHLHFEVLENNQPVDPAKNIEFQ